MRTKGMLKRMLNRNKKHNSKLVKAAATVLSSFAIAGMPLTFSACAPTKGVEIPEDDPTKIENSVTLPSCEELNDFFSSYLYPIGKEFNMFVYKEINVEQIHRIVENNAGIEIGIGFSTNEAQQLMLQRTIDEYNEFFGVVNPCYKFVLNLEDNQNSSIEVNIGNASEVQFELKDITSGIDGNEIVRSKIILSNNVLSNSATFYKTFKGLLMKSIGGLDYYFSGNTKSVMCEHHTDTTNFSELDLVYLSQLYKNSSIEQDKVAEYIKHAKNSKKYSYSMIRAELSVNEVLEVVKQLKGSDMTLSDEKYNFTENEVKKFEKFKKVIDEQGVDSITAADDIAFGECVEMKGKTSPIDGYKYLKFEDGKGVLTTLKYDQRDIWKDLRATTFTDSLICNNGVAVDYKGHGYVKFGNYLLQISYDYNVDTKEITYLDYSHFYEQTNMSMQEYFEQTGVVWDNVNKNLLDDLLNGLKNDDSLTM